MTLRRALILLMVFGCVYIFVDVLISHFEVLKDEPFSRTPLLISFLGFLAFLWAFLKWNKASVLALRVMSILFILTALAGIYFHNEDRFEAEAKEVYEEKEVHEELPPPIAPLSLAGLGILGLMLTYQGWKKE